MGLGGISDHGNRLISRTKRYSAVRAGTGGNGHIEHFASDLPMPFVRSISQMLSLFGLRRLADPLLQFGKGHLATVQRQDLINRQV